MSGEPGVMSHPVSRLTGEAVAIAESVASRRSWDTSESMVNERRRQSQRSSTSRCEVYTS